MRRLALVLVIAAVAASCGGGKSGPVTGLVVTIDYDGDVARVEVSGAAETTGRQFGPWSLTSQQLVSGGTVGFVFDAGDAGSAMICAQTFDSSDNAQDFDCEVFDVRADETTDGTIDFTGVSGDRTNNEVK
jgi:hypothetical protein